MPVITDIDELTTTDKEVKRHHEFDDNKLKCFKLSRIRSKLTRSCLKPNLP